MRRLALLVVLVLVLPSLGRAQTCDSLPPTLFPRTAPGGGCPTEGCIEIPPYNACRGDVMLADTGLFLDTYTAFIHLANTFTVKQTFNAGLDTTAIKLSTGSGVVGRCLLSTGTDGTAGWGACPSGGGGGSVNSFNGRGPDAGGNIAPQEGDYSLALLSGVTGQKGTGTTVQMFGTGNTTSGHCAAFDSGGNITDSGAACGGGGGGPLAAAYVVTACDSQLTNESLLQGSAGITVTPGSGNCTSTFISTTSMKAGFLGDGGSTNLTCGSGNQGKMQVMDDGTLQYCDGAATSLLKTLDPSATGGSVAFDTTNVAPVESSAITKLVCDGGNGFACDVPSTDVARIKLNRQGDGTKVQMFGTGAPGTNECAKFDGAGNIVPVGGGAVCSTGSSGFSTDEGTYYLSDWRWDDNHAMGPMTWGPVSNGLMGFPSYGTQLSHTAQARWGGSGTRYNGELTKAGGIRGGLDWSIGPPFLPRGSYVGLNEVYTPDPPNLRFYQVTQAGVTAATQPDGSGAASGYPVTWEPRWPRKLNSYVYSDELGETLVYEVTASQAPCAGFSCRCFDSGPGSGSCCYTGYTRFDFSTCTTVDSQCTTFDGTCKYTPRLATHANATVITDGTAQLTKIGDDAYHLGSSAYSVNSGLSIVDNRFESQVRDNESAPAFILGRNTNATPGNFSATAQRRRDQTNENPFWLVEQGDSRSGLAREIGYTQDGYAPVYQAEGSLRAPYPSRPPTVTLSGAAGVTGTDFCFAYAWENIKTGGRTTLSPYACASPTNQVVTVAVSGFTWPADVRAIVFMGFNSLGWFRIGELANSSATLPSSAWLLCDGGTQNGKTCTSNADCTGGGTCSPEPILHEHEMGYTVNNSGNELFGLRSGDAPASTWTTGQNWLPDDVVRPQTPNGFKYLLVACGCDSACTSCSQPWRTLSCTTSGSPPAWDTAMAIGSTVCESNGGSSLKWKNVGPDNPTALISASNTTRDILQFKEAYDQMSSNVWRTLGGINYAGDLYLNNKTVGSWWLNPTLLLSGRGTAGGEIGFGAGGTNTLDIELHRTGVRTLTIDGIGAKPTVQFAQVGSNPFLILDNGGGSAGGRLQFGDGSATADVDLYRQGVNVLATHDSLLLESTGTPPNAVPVEIRFKGTSSGYSAFQAGGQGSAIWHYVWPTTLNESSCLKTGASPNETTLSWGPCGTGGGSLAYDATNDSTLESSGLTKLVCEGIGMACDEPTADVARIKLNPHGSGTTVQMFGGGTAATDTCAKFDSSGNIISTGAACGSGGGSNGWSLTSPYTDTAGGVRVIPGLGASPFPFNPLTIYNSYDAYQANTRPLTVERSGALALYGLPRIGRGQQVAVGEYYAPDPAFKCGFKVTQAGMTADFRPLEWPIIRYSKQPLAIGQRVLRDTQCETRFYYTVTSIQGGGTCAAECSNAGTACSSNDTCTGCGVTGFGCQCTTGTTKPTADCFDGGADHLNPGPNGCTFTDGTCNFTATTYPSNLSITDNTAIFQNDTIAYGAYRNAPTVETRSGDGGDPGNATQLLTGDNGTYQFMLGHAHGYKLDRGNPAFGTQWKTIMGPGYYGDTPGPEPKMALLAERGPTFSVRFPPETGGLGQDGALYQAWIGDYIGLAPQAGPTVTLTSGGNLTQGGRYCFSQAWQNRSTGGITAHGPETCVYPTATLKSVTLTPNPVSWTQSPYAWDPLVLFYWGKNYVATAANFSDVITITDPIGSGQPHGWEENQYNDPFSLSNDPFVEIGSARMEGATTWTTGLTLQPKSEVKPSTPWTTTPPTPFTYHVTGTHCNGSCQSCYTSPVTASQQTTSGNEPTWRIDAGLFCDSQGIQYQRSYWYKNGVSIAATTAQSYDADSSDLLVYRSNVSGESALFRSYLGRPQYVCNSETKPTCSAATRGLVWYTCNSGLNEDVEERCTKTGQSTYAWRGANGGMICSKATIGEAALTGTTAGATEDETLFNLPANAKMIGTTIKHTAAFTGGGLTSMTVSIGTSTDPTYYSAPFDVFQAPGAAFYLDSGPQYKSATSAGDTVYARFTPDASHSVSAATAGSVDIRYCYVTFP